MHQKRESKREREKGEFDDILSMSISRLPMSMILASGLKIMLIWNISNVDKLVNVQLGTVLVFFFIIIKN